MNDIPGASDEFHICFCIADLPTRLTCSGLDEAARRRIEAHYAGFACQCPPQQPGMAACASVHVTVAAGEPFLPLEPPRWRVRTWREDDRVRFLSHLEAGWFDLSTGRGELTLRPNGNPENYLRVLYAWRCLDDGALLVHAGGVLRSARGWVFFGPSGSGKTTAVHLSSDAQTLSDDLVVLKCEQFSAGPGVRVFGVPFRGDLPEAPRLSASAALAGLFALEKSGEHGLAPLSHAESIARLAASIPFVMVQPREAARVLELCAEINRRVPARLLRFRRDPGFWSLIDDQPA